MKKNAVFLLGLAALAAAGLAAAQDEVVVPPPQSSYWVPLDGNRMPSTPREARVNGCVALSFVVEPDGRPSTITVLASHPEDVFDRLAVGAVKRWRFEPGPDNPDTQPALMTQAIDFELEDAINGPVSCVQR